MILKGLGQYTGEYYTTYTIAKAENPLKLKNKSKKTVVRHSKLKKRSQTLKFSKVVKVVKAGKGKMTYTRRSGNKKIKINKKTGKVTIKKGLKKGTYKVSVKVRAVGDTNYKASTTKTVTFKIRVK
ncbi:MAG: hypothetical protein IKF07_08320 [Eubacterium sp.]|nr:hypothetical protein [Eubacterium sp.]